MHTMFRSLLPISLAAALLAGCAGTPGGGGDARSDAARALPPVEAHPGYEEWAPMGEVGVAFGPAIAGTVFDGLSTADKVTLLTFSRSPVATDAEFATLRYTAPNGWTFERMFLRGDATRRCRLFEFRATRAGATATGFALGCPVRSALLAYQVAGSDVTSQNLIDSLLSFVPEGRLENPDAHVRAEAGARFKVTPAPTDWEELGARRSQWRRDLREDAPVLVSAPGKQG